MNGSVKRRLVVGGVVALATAGSGAAVAARAHHAPARSLAAPRAYVFAGPMRARAGIFSAVLNYLGLTREQLRTQLQSGKTLGQIADATPGKSAAGLVDAIVTAAKQDLAAAVSAGRLTQAQADRISAGLQQRVTQIVDSTRPKLGPFGHGYGRALGGPFAAAATYLGISPQTLFADLRSGKTLAQIAGATPGKSAAGLVAALVADVQQRLAKAVASGRLTQAQADRISANLQQRITAIVNGTVPKRGGFFRGYRPHAGGVTA